MESDSESCILLNGLLITFEGGEGAGKSSLMYKLAGQLRSEGYPVLDTREPGGTALGEDLRKLLLHSKQKEEISPRAELFLFLAARAQHVEKVILPALAERKIVLCDRFNDSSIAYQGHARGLGVGYVRQLCELASFAVQPNLTFLLDVRPEIGLERARTGTVRDRLEEEELVFHERVREGFLKLRDEEPDRIHLIDGSLIQAKVYERVYEILESVLKP